MLTLSFDESRNVIVVDANRLDIDHIPDDIDAVLDHLVARPEAGILLYRHKPETRTMDFSQISTVGPRQETILNALKGRRIACLVEPGLRFGVGRQIASFLEILGIEYQPFTDETEAIHWLSD